jgi:transcriptional regulator with XRE-family HTH domain
MGRRGVRRFRPDSLRAARLRNGLSLSALARLIGATPSVVGRYESGTAQPGPTALLRLAEVLGVATTHLAPLSSSPTLAEYRERAGLTLRCVAQATGHALSSVSRVENGTYYPSDPALWAEVYGLKAEVFREAWIPNGYSKQT